MMKGKKSRPEKESTMPTGIDEDTRETGSRRIRKEEAHLALI